MSGYKIMLLLLLPPACQNLGQAEYPKPVCMSCKYQFVDSMTSMYAMRASLIPVNDNVRHLKMLSTD